MNYLELCQDLVELAGISGTFETTASQTGEFKRVTNWIRRAVREVEGRWFDWDFLYVRGDVNTFPTVVGVQDYPAPTLLNKWDQNAIVRASEDQQLEYYPWTRIKAQTYLNEDSDVYAFTIMPNKTLRLYGIPTAVETIQAPYWLRPTELSDDTDSPLIPVQFHDIVVYKALQYYANYESADEVKVQAQEGYTQWLMQLESHSAPGRQGHGNVNTGQDIEVYTESNNYYGY